MEKDGGVEEQKQKASTWMLETGAVRQWRRSRITSLDGFVLIDKSLFGLLSNNRSSRIKISRDVTGAEPRRLSKDGDGIYSAIFCSQRKLIGLSRNYPFPSLNVSWYLFVCLKTVALSTSLLFSSVFINNLQVIVFSAEGKHPHIGCTDFLRFINWTWILHNFSLTWTKFLINFLSFSPSQRLRTTNWVIIHIIHLYNLKMYSFVWLSTEFPFAPLRKTKSSESRRTTQPPRCSLSCWATEGRRNKAETEYKLKLVKNARHFASNSL